MTGKTFISAFPLLFVGLAAASSLLSFRYHYPNALKKMSVLWVLNFGVDLAGHIIKHYGKYNQWLYTIYFWIMYMALAYLYDQQITNKQVRTSIRWFYVLFPMLVIAETIFYGIEKLQTDVIVWGGVFMIFLAVAYFRQLYLSEENEPITRDPWFWFSFGFIIHFGGTVPFFGILNYLWSHNYKEFASFYYLYFSNSYTILLNILIITGFLCRRNYQKSH